MYNYIFIFIFGITFGSFLNATGIRIANILENFYKKNENTNYFKIIMKEFSLFKYSNKPKQSICPICKNKLKWWHNIPIISYIILKGKCFYCKNSIPFIYFLSEIFVGFIFVLEYYYYLNIHHNLNIFISTLIFFNILYIGIITDIKTMLIPDSILILSMIPLIYLNIPLGFDNIKYFLITITFAYIIYYIQVIINKYFIGIQDIKIYAFGILLYGIDNFLNIIFISNLIALPFYIYFKLKNKENIKDFGIYIYITLLIFPLLLKYNFFLL